MFGIYKVFTIFTYNLKPKDMKSLIKDLKKNDQFKFNHEIYTVKQKYSDWKKDYDGYLMTTCGQVFYHDELEIEKI